MPVICFSSSLTRWKSYCWALPRMFPKPWFAWKGWGPTACAGFRLRTLPLGPARLAAGQVGAPSRVLHGLPARPGARLYLLHGHPPKGSLFSKEGEVRQTASQWADKIFDMCPVCENSEKWHRLQRWPSASFLSLPDSQVGERCLEFRKLLEITQKDKHPGSCLISTSDSTAVSASARNVMLF